MRFLLDQDVYATTASFLRGLGHDVVPVAQIGRAQADDEELLKIASEQGRIFITRDRDFGNLVFVKGLGAGVLYLRILPSAQNAVHDELERVLNTYAEEELAKAFIVVGPSGQGKKAAGEVSPKTRECPFPSSRLQTIISSAKKLSPAAPSAYVLGRTARVINCS